MQIDWFTFGAQIVNFLILIGLLKRFLYGPLLNAIDRREAVIAERIQKAQAQQQEAERVAEQYRAMQEDLEAERDERLAEAEQAAEERRRALIEQAREDIEYLAHQWRQALVREQTAALQAVSKRAVEETLALARRVLTDLADARLEDQAVAVFVSRLQALDDDDASDLAAACRAANGRATLRSAFPLSESQLDRLQNALQGVVDRDVQLMAETDEALGFGVELRVEHQTVAWSLDSYLTTLLERVREELDAALQKAVRTDRPGPSADGATARSGEPVPANRSERRPPESSATGTESAEANPSANNAS